MSATPTVSLAGRYRLLRRVASGGTSAVHLAHDDLLDRQVAVKRLHPHLAEDPVFVDRFRREAMAVAAITHPNVVAIHDVALDGTWLVMEHVDGQSLRDVLSLRGRLQPGQALALLAPAAAGLAAAHDAGIVHRDVKPDNILVGSDGTVKVGDFGLARAAASSTQTFGPEAFAGSPHYLSPEVVRGEGADARTDVYALGIVLFELLSGRPPLDGDTPFAIAMAHTTGRVPAPSTVVPGVSKALDNVVFTATQPDPTLRHPDAAAFAADLRAAVPDGPLAIDLRVGEHDTVVLPMDLPDTRVIDRPRPRRLRRLLVPLILAVLVGGGWLVWDQVVAPVTAIQVTAGDDVDAATAALETAGFTVVLADAGTDAEIPAGAVLSVSPADGARRGQTVTVTPSAGPAMVEIPRVVGFGEQAAITALDEAGLATDVARQFSPTVPAGQVITTVPTSTTVVAETERVQVVVSQGREPLTVPDVRGDTLATATATLERLGLVVGTISERDDVAIPAGTVIDQGEEPGIVRFRDDRVGLVVSAGPPAFVLDDVRGLNSTDAIAQLEALGLEIDVVTVETSNDARVGTVDEQAPSAGQDIRPGAIVTLFVWTAAPD